MLRLNKIIFFISIFLLVFAISFAQNSLDFDLWARLIMGKHIIEAHSIMYKDIISFTPTHTWFDPEWITSALIYLIQIKFGLLGLNILKGLLIFLLVVSINIAIKEKNVQNPYNLGYYLIIVFLLKQVGIFYALRCQVLTFIFCAMWILFLEKIKKGNNKYLIYLVILSLIWLNCHGGIIAGVGLLGLYLIGEFLNKNDYKKYFLALVVIFFIFFINPWGVDYLKFILDSSFLDRSWIAEWQSPFTFSFKNIFLYQFLVVITYFCYFYKIYLKKLKFKDLDKTKLLIILTATVLSFKYIKHTGLMVVLYSIFMYDDYFLTFNDLAEKLRKYLQFEINSKKYFNLIKNIVLYLIIYVYSLTNLITSNLNYTTTKNVLSNYPISSINFLEQNNIKGNILSPFQYNSFMGYRLYPNIKIFMDGRQEQVYYSNIFDEMMFFYLYLGKNPLEILDKYDIDILMVEKEFPIYKHLKEIKNFKVIYDNGANVILIKENKLKNDYKYEYFDSEKLMDNIFKTNLDFGVKK